METKGQRNYARRKRRRELWFAAHGPCARCGSWERLTLDHIDPTSKDPRLKVGNAGSIWAWSNANRALELAKCQVLCKPCHDAKTVQERFGGPAEHGTRSKYNGPEKCRCDACCKSQSDYMREYGKTYYMTYYRRDREQINARRRERYNQLKTLRRK